MKIYQKQIGDGKLPNKYFVFQYNQKYKRVQNEEGISLELIEEDLKNKNSYLGWFKTYQEALECVDSKSYLSNVIIEDRISGQVFEQMCIVCQECGKEEWKTFQDIKYTKEELEKKGIEFK